jgi:uncharacterized delta-60 repeat protein
LFGFVKQLPGKTINSEEEMKLKKIGIITANLFFLLTLSVNLHALPGDLDPAFDFDGTTLTPIGIHDYAADVVIQPDGKIVVTGQEFNNSTNTRNFALVRYNSDGSLDSGFGTGGKVLFTENGTQVPGEVLLQPDGKILLIGYVNRNQVQYSLAVFVLIRTAVWTPASDPEAKLFTISSIVRKPMPPFFKRTAKLSLPGLSSSAVLLQGLRFSG